MQRRRFLASAALGVTTSALAAPAVAEAAPELRWRLTTGFPAALDIIQGTAGSFARNVAEATDGRFRIELQSQPEGFDPARSFDDIAAGRVDAALTASSYAIDKDPTFALLTAAPFGLNTRQQNAWLYEVGGLDLAKAWAAIRASSGNSFVHETEGQLILSGSYDIGFTMDLACKDLGFALAMGRQFGVPLEVAGLVEQTFIRARQQLGAGAWSTAVVKLLEDALGEQLRAAGFPARLEPV